MAAAGAAIKSSGLSSSLRKCQSRTPQTAFFPALDGLKLNDEVLKEGSFILKAEAVRQHPKL
jgi:hypothetical protein